MTKYKKSWQRRLLPALGQTESVRSHLLVTNDFPPKVGGIQSYLFELWRRLPSESATVYCTPHSGAVAFDAAQSFRIERSPEPFLLPYPWLKSRICRLADEVGAELIILDPALPLGHIGPSLGRPYGVVLHGAEVTVPARMPGSRQLLRRVLQQASLVISAGEYALAEAETCAGRSLPSVVIAPGVDPKRFVPPTVADRAAARRHFDLSDDALVISSVNRLVPRKGMDRLIQASAKLATTYPRLQVLIGGTGREAKRLEELVAETRAPVRLLGWLSDPDVARLYQATDVMAMLCHDRWRGLEQEGFGIAFLEAAACGVPQVAGNSGGAAEAVVHNETGVVVNNPDDQSEIEAALDTLLRSDALRLRMGQAGRRRVEAEFDYEHLAGRLGQAIGSVDLPDNFDVLRAADRHGEGALGS